MIDSWQSQIYHEHSKVMKQQSNKVTAASQGLVKTVTDHLALAVFKSSEVSDYTDMRCSK